MNLFSKLLWIGLPAFVATSVSAEDKTSSEAETLSDEPTFRQIFRRSVDDAASLESEHRRDSLTAELSASVSTPSQLVLTNKYFEVPHSESLSSMPGVQLGFAFGLASSSRWQLGGTVSTGYSYSQYVGTAKSLKTGYESTDELKLQRVPFGFGLRGAYDTGPVTLFLEPSVGVQWLSQSGYLDGVSQSFWVPTGGLTAGAILFDGSHRSNSWFGGVRVAAGLERSLSSDQKLDAKHFELGVRARL